MKNRSRGIGQGTRGGIVEALAAEGETVRIVVVGGTALILRGVVSRLTEDVDILAVVRSPEQGAPARMETPDPLPAPLLRAAARVARDFNLAGDWMNSAVGAQWKTGCLRVLRSACAGCNSGGWAWVWLTGWISSS